MPDDNTNSVLVGLGVVVLVGWCIVSKRINGVMRAGGVDRAIFGDSVVDTRDGVAGKCMSMLYGKLPSSHVPQVGMLSGILFCIIGVYWLLRSLKVARARRLVHRLRRHAPFGTGARRRTGCRDCLLYTSPSPRD